ncbi:MAG: hypothetical protein FWF78_07590 [Defluviitaleaceae bacterium]|nr:hypothetical protein [Defluviitaleaceae bacterium]
MFKIALCFGVFNIALVVLVWVFWGGLAYLGQGQALVRRYESRYAAVTRMADEFENNLHELGIINERMLHGSEVFYVLSVLNAMAETYGKVVDFLIAETALTDRILETNARMAIVGDFYDIIDFLKKFSEGREEYVHMRSFYISDIMHESESARSVRLYFSLFSIVSD